MNNINHRMQKVKIVIAEHKMAFVLAVVVAVLAAGLALSSGTPGEGALGGLLAASAQAAGLGDSETVQALQQQVASGKALADAPGAQP